MNHATLRLEPGQRFVVPNGMNITPTYTTAVIVWVDKARDTVHYRLEDAHRGDIRETTIDRFISIARGDAWRAGVIAQRG